MRILLPLVPILVFGALVTAENPGRNSLIVAKANNAFGVDLYRILSPQESNIFFSPFSISMALAMLLYGTTGESAEELKQALWFKQIGLSEEDIYNSLKDVIEFFSQGSDRYQLHVANALVASDQYPIEKKYKGDIANIFQALVTDADFKNSDEVVKQINEWVSNMTNGQITKLLEVLQPNAVLLILNAVYFKGNWQSKFKPEFTRNAYFFNRGSTNRKVKVPMMHLTEKLRYARLGDITVLELPYEGGEICMLLLISEYIAGLPELEEELDLNMLRAIRRLMRKTEVTLILPKFKLRHKIALNDVLKKMGINNIFGAHANLTGISKSNELTVSQVLHEAAIDVNEEGTEASGSTVIEVQTRTGGSQIYVRADHPFLFAIVDTRNDMILFQGRVNEL